MKVVCIEGHCRVRTHVQYPESGSRDGDIGNGLVFVLKLEESSSVTEEVEQIADDGVVGIESTLIGWSGTGYDGYGEEHGVISTVKRRVRET